MSAIPITVWKVNGPQSPRMERIDEAATQTALIGVPSQLSGGYVQECATIDDAPPADMILGFSTEFFHNLADAGVGVPLTYGAVQNQADAVLIPVGAPIADGKMGVLIAESWVEFVGGAEPGTSFDQTDIGSIAGLTKSSNGFWAVDPSKAAEGDGACIKITTLVDPAGTDGGRVAFQVLSDRQQINEV